MGHVLSPERRLDDNPLTEAALHKPPPSFPPSSIKLKPHEARLLVDARVRGKGNEKSFLERFLISFKDCDVIAFRTSREMEGVYCAYVETQLEKPVILAGPIVPDYHRWYSKRNGENFLTSSNPDQ